MPGNHDIVSIPISGLVRGGDQNPDCKTAGLLVFVRGNVDVDNETFSADNDECDTNKGFSKEARIAKLYRENVYYPFIQSTRRDFGHHDERGVPTYLRAISWQDGCDGQLKLVTSESSLNEDAKRNIVACKQSTARTCTEQSADVGSCFKSFRREQRGMSAAENRHRNRGLVKRIEDAIKEKSEEGELELEKFKFDAIVHLVSKTPSCQSASFSAERIMQGFIKNGQISSMDSPVPDIKGTLGTLRYAYPDQSIQHLTKLFNTFFPIMYDNGHIEELDYDKFGTKNDTNSLGRSYQRAHLPSDPKTGKGQK
jgi:hypothetical protein